MVAIWLAARVLCFTLLSLCVPGLCLSLDLAPITYMLVKYIFRLTPRLACTVLDDKPVVYSFHRMLRASTPLATLAASPCLSSFMLKGTLPIFCPTFASVHSCIVSDDCFPICMHFVDIFCLFCRCLTDLAGGQRSNKLQYSEPTKRCPNITAT